MASLHRLLWAVACCFVAEAAQRSSDRTITQVVTLLQEMLDKSKADSDTERTLYAKYKCYCDNTEEEKTTEISTLETQIALLENKIEELLASTAGLSKEVAQLKKDMAANVKARADAKTLRDNENADFLAKEGDLDGAITTMKEAIDELAAVGADQTFSVAGDHTQYMAGMTEKNFSLVDLKANLKQALIAASAFVSQHQAAAVDSFIQGPSFTGTYSAQSGEVVGILKDMRKTFQEQLASSRAEEAKALAAYLKLKANLENAHGLMETAHDAKNLLLSGNDASLASKRGELDTAKQDLTAAQGFLESLQGMCSAKAKQYQERVSLRTREEAAIAEAISILNSDAAFASFGTVSATKDGAVSFVQFRAVRAHAQQVQESPRQKAQKFLEKAAKTSPKASPLLQRVASMLQANNPFTVVLAEIDKMVGLIAAEETADDQQKSWCDSERSDTDGSITTKGGQIVTLTGVIDGLNTDIDDPATGLKVTIENTEKSLLQNHESEATETATRQKENADYQADVANLVEAEQLLAKAIDVLHAYYNKIIHDQGGDFLQKKRQDPTPPATWEDTYAGQSVKGNSALDMLRFIMTNTKSEETQAHQDELTAQHNYEDSMQQIRTSRATLQGSLAQQKETLAQKEEQLLEKTKERAATEKEKAALEAYLEEIKPGCDFITTNIAVRKANRADETLALQNAKTLLKATPAYIEAEAVAHNETLGDCVSICAGHEEHVDCKACLASTSVPGYCAGHPTTEGC